MFHLDSNAFGYICAGVSNMDGYKGNTWSNLSFLLRLEYQGKTFR